MKYAANSCRHVQMSAALAIHPFFFQEAVEDARGKVRANGQGGRKEKGIRTMSYLSIAG